VLKYNAENPDYKFDGIHLENLVMVRRIFSLNIPRKLRALRID